MFRLRPVILVTTLAFALGAGLACSWAEDLAQEPDETNGEESLIDLLLFDCPEDCLPEESYDPVERLCYLEVDCESEEDCQDLLDQIYGSLLELEEGIGSTNPQAASDDYSYLEPGTLVTYQVQGNDLVNPLFSEVSADLLELQNDTAAHARIWSYFASLIPHTYRTSVSRFVVYTDGEQETLALVEPDPDDPTRWLLVVDIVDAAKPEELTHTLIHEFGHLLTLDSSQVPPDLGLYQQPDDEQAYDSAVQACAWYFTGEGCSQPDSYINLFYDRFWSAIRDEWDLFQDIEDDEDYYRALEDFYQTYQDQFVSDYAATNPGEDIAESWTFFVLRSRPAGSTIADEKILFFYEYPELVQLRSQILARTVSRLRRSAP